MCAGPTCARCIPPARQRPPCTNHAGRRPQRAQYAPAGRPAACPCAHGTRCTRSVVPEPSLQALHHAHAHVYSLGNRTVAHPARGLFAHDPPRLRHGHLELRAHVNPLNRHLSPLEGNHKPLARCSCSAGPLIMATFCPLSTDAPNGGTMAIPTWHHFHCGSTGTSQPASGFDAAAFPSIVGVLPACLQAYRLRLLLVRRVKGFWDDRARFRPPARSRRPRSHGRRNVHPAFQFSDGIIANQSPPQPWRLDVQCRLRSAPQARPSRCRRHGVSTYR